MPVLALFESVFDGLCILLHRKEPFFFWISTYSEAKETMDFPAFFPFQDSSIKTKAIVAWAEPVSDFSIRNGMETKSQITLGFNGFNMFPY